MSNKQGNKNVVVVPFKYDAKEVYPPIGRPLTEGEFNAWSQAMYEYDVNREARKMSYKMLAKERVRVI